MKIFYSCSLINGVMISCRGFAVLLVLDLLVYPCVALENVTISNVVAIKVKLSSECWKNSIEILNVEDSLKCKAEFDPEWYCWSQAPSSSTIVTSCPPLLYNTSVGWMKRRCFENGTWDTFIDKSQCVKLDIQQTWWNARRFFYSHNVTLSKPSYIEPTPSPPFQVTNQRLNVTMKMLKEFLDQAKENCLKDAFRISSVSNGRKCSVEYETPQCWSEALHNTTLRMPCNSIFYRQGYIERTCHANGSWSFVNISNCQTYLTKQELNTRLYDAMEEVGVNTFVKQPSDLLKSTDALDLKAGITKGCLDSAFKIKELDESKKCQTDVDWKYLQCWSETPINSTAFIPCPPVFFLPYQGVSRRRCLSNGSWEEYSNSSFCVRRTSQEILQNIITEYKSPALNETTLNTTEAKLLVPYKKEKFEAVLNGYCQNTTQKLDVDNSMKCPGIVGRYFQCWPDSLLNMTLTMPCSQIFFLQGVIKRRCKDSGDWDIEDHSECVRRPTLEAVVRLKNFGEKLGFKFIPDNHEVLKVIYTIKCETRLNESTTNVDGNASCKGYMDEYHHCWMDTPSNATVQLPCISMYFHTDGVMNRRCGMDGQWEQLKVNAICRPLDQQQKITRWKSLAKFYGIELTSKSGKLLVANKILILCYMIASFVSFELLVIIF